MATRADFYAETRGYGLEDDCPNCGASWPMCHGQCVEHEAANGLMGPFHEEYNDDCALCASDRSRVIDGLAGQADIIWNLTIAQYQQGETETSPALRDIFARIEAVLAAADGAIDSAGEHACADDSCELMGLITTYRRLRKCLTNLQQTCK